LSRGAMRHHYASKIEIVEELVDYLCEKRLYAFKTTLKTVPPGDDQAHFVLEALRQQFNHPSHMVFLELSMASRTDKALAAIVRPSKGKLNAAYLELAAEMLPECPYSPQELATALNLTRYLLEGMAIDLVAGENSEEIEALLARLEQSLHAPGEDPAFQD